MNRFVAACDRIKAQNCCTILIVHHSGVQSKERARGSSVLRAASDFEYRIERAVINSTALVLTCTKSKDEREQPSQLFELTEQELFIDADGDVVTSLVCGKTGKQLPQPETSNAIFEPGANHIAIIEAVEERMAIGESTEYSDIREHLASIGIPINQYSVWIKRLVKEGYLRRSEDDVLTIVDREVTEQPFRFVSL